MPFVDLTFSFPLSPHFLKVEPIRPPRLVRSDPFPFLSLFLAIPPSPHLIPPRTIRLSLTFPHLPALASPRTQKGPVPSARPGYRSPYLGHKFPLADLLPALSLFDVDDSTGIVTEDAPWDWNEKENGGPGRVTLVEFWASW